MNSPEIWTPHATVATLIEQDGHFLLVEERDSEGRQVFNQPAGHVEERESILDAAVRETLEETGWRVELTYFIGIYTYLAYNGVTYYRFCFAANALQKDQSATLDTDIVGTHWLTRDDLLERRSQWRSPLLMQCIDDYLAGKRFPLDLIYEHPVSNTSETPSSTQQPEAES